MNYYWCYTKYLGVAIEIKMNVIIFSRSKSRRGNAQVSYKEQTESEDLSEGEGETTWQEGEVTAEVDTAETIEKVLAQRRGKKGGQF